MRLMKPPMDRGATPSPEADGPVEQVSASDPRLDPYRALRDPDLVRAGEGAGWFIGEQALVIERMLARPGITISILASEKMAERAQALRDASADRSPPIYVADDEVLEAIVGFDLHRGLLALGRRPEDGRARIDRALADPTRPIALLGCEDIRNIDNIGLLFRNAAAFGVDGVLLSPECHDPLYRKSLRVSIGHALDVPFARLDPWIGGPERIGGLGELRGHHGFEILGAATDPSAVPIGSIEPPRRFVLLMGSEFPGLTADAKSACDRLVRIPMAEGVDSLNVAVAAAVCLSHLCGPRLEASRSART
jgi:tRNA G18 (ribose-2'-O)-methylase SpoU